MKSYRLISYSRLGKPWQALVHRLGLNCCGERSRNSIRTSIALRSLEEQLQKSRDFQSQGTQQLKRDIISAIHNCKPNTNNEEEVTMVSSMLTDMAARERKIILEQQLLHSLSYHRMRDRRQQILEHHEATLDWLFDKKGSKRWPGAEFDDWLTKGHGLYWISGKAGSGKSTLMKFLSCDQKTRKALSFWAQGSELVIASFFFWNPGIAMQKSQLGLLQSLMYEIICQHPELIPTLLPIRWRSYIFYGGDPHPWTLPELCEAFDLLHNQATITDKFCFFIDGLDEFDGKHSDIMKIVLAMTNSPNMKICVSSRPWNIFKDVFSEFPKLFLQDLNRQDIEEYVDRELFKDKHFERLRERDQDTALQLVSEIVENSSGVFLWVFLVVQNLLEGLSNADRIDALYARLRELPTDLESFFMYMLKDTTGLYLNQATQLFQLALESPEPLSLLTLSYFDEVDPEYPFTAEVRTLEQREVDARCEDIKRKLQSRCKGLLEVRRATVAENKNRPWLKSPAEFDGVAEVHFLHRTVRDFLSTPTVKYRLVAIDSETFNAHTTLLRAFVTQIKGIGRLKTRQALKYQFRSLVYRAIYHASCVEKTTGLSQRRLLNELDRVASLFSTSLFSSSEISHWSDDGGFADHPNGALSSTPFLAFAIKCGLKLYVKETLDLDSTLLSNHSGRPLLLYVFSARGGKRLMWDHVWWNNYVLEMPDLGILRVLLERGANPNKYHNEGTVWQHFLHAVHYRALLANKRHVDSEHDSEVANSWADATALFISHGADPDARDFAFTSLFDEYHQGEPVAAIIKMAFLKHLAEPLESLLQQQRNRRGKYGQEQRLIQPIQNARIEHH